MTGIPLLVVWPVKYVMRIAVASVDQCHDAVHSLLSLCSPPGSGGVTGRVSRQDIREDAAHLCEVQVTLLNGMQVGSVLGRLMAQAKEWQSQSLPGSQVKCLSLLVILAAFQAHAIRTISSAAGAGIAYRGVSKPLLKCGSFHMTSRSAQECLPGGISLAAHHTFMLSGAHQVQNV